MSIALICKNSSYIVLFKTLHNVMRIEVKNYSQNCFILLSSLKFLYNISLHSLDCTCTFLCCIRFHSYNNNNISWNNSSNNSSLILHGFLVLLTGENDQGMSKLHHMN